MASHLSARFEQYLMLAWPVGDFANKDLADRHMLVAWAHRPLRSSPAAFSAAALAFPALVVVILAP